MNNREAFEAWAEKELLPLDRRDSEHYRYNLTNRAWAGFQAALASQAQQPTLPHDFYTHRQCWRNALVIAEAHAKVHAPDVDDKAYWRHELAAFDRAYAELQSQAQQESAIAVELESVTSQIEDGYGIWMTCSGCHETEDGHSVGNYKFSSILNCTLGSGCHECGGLGATWETFCNESPAPGGDKP